MDASIVAITREGQTIRVRLGPGAEFTLPLDVARQMAQDMAVATRPGGFELTPEMYRTK